jgi:hypothetical protein
METKCDLIDCTNNSNQNIISYIHKWREYGGYSQNEYPRFFCSQECLNFYEKNYKCNYCHIVLYDWRNNIKATNEYTYCDDEDELTIGNTTCYNQWLIKKNLLAASSR